MLKESLFINNFCENILRYSIYILIFLLPILFLPWTSDALDFNKQTFLVLFVFVALFAWLAKILISGKISIKLNKTNIAVLVLFLAFLVSTIFSTDKYGSFWGWPRVTSESFLTVLCFIIFYFLVSNVFSKKEIIASIILFALSGLLVVSIGVSQLLGLFLPFNFAKSPSFNTIGMVGELGLFIAILLPLLIVLEIYSKKWLRIIFGAGILLSIISFVLINYAIVWWIVLVGCALFILVAVAKKEFFDLRWLGIPMFFLVLALSFIILQVQIPSPQRPIEVYLNQATSLGISFSALKEYPVFGSGPGTFSYVFSKYKGSDLNQGILWNLKFNSAGAKAITILATTGILGFASFLALIAATLFYGAKFMIGAGREREAGQRGEVFISAVLVAFAAQTTALFFYGSNLALDFLFFFLIACFLGLFAEEKKEFSLRPSSFATLFVTFIATLFFIFGVGLLFLNGQRYVAEIYYTKGILNFAFGQKDEGLQKLESAVRLNPKSDVYLTQLSQAYLFRLGDVIADASFSDEDKSAISQLLMNNSVNAAKIATDVSPKNANNWAVRGLVYRNLIGAIVGVEDWALHSYEQAIQLEPSNPYYATQKGIVYMTKAAIVNKDDNAKRNEDLDNAKKEFDRAVELKSDYAPARFQIAMFYQAKGQIDEGIKALEELKAYSPDDVGLLFQLGLIYYQEKDFNKAKLNLESAVSVSPNYSNALYFLGLTYYKLGQSDKAIEKFEKVLEFNPGNEEVRVILANLKEGKDPLSGIIQEIPPQAPIDETSVETP